LSSIYLREEGINFQARSVDSTTRVVQPSQPSHDSLNAVAAPRSNGRPVPPKTFSFGCALGKVCLDTTFHIGPTR
jgi:hypothetical protein